MTGSFMAPEIHALAQCVTFRSRSINTREVCTFLRIEESRSRNQIVKKHLPKSMGALGTLGSLVIERDKTTISFTRIAFGLDSLNWRLIHSILEHLFRYIRLSAFLTQDNISEDCCFHRISHSRKEPVCTKS